jgi:NagD protein
MDGVLIKGKSLIPGADHFIAALQERNIPYLVLTNNPMYTPRDLSHRLATIGLNVPQGNIFTSALAQRLLLAKAA